MNDIDLFKVSIPKLLLSSMFWVTTKWVFKISSVFSVALLLRKVRRSVRIKRLFRFGDRSSAGVQKSLNFWKTRQNKVNQDSFIYYSYYTAIYYIKLERHGKAWRYMQKAKKDLSEIEKDKKKLAEDYLENNKKFYKVYGYSFKLFFICLISVLKIKFQT